MSFLLPSAAILATPLKALELVVLDSETTGLDTERARVVELAAVRVRAGYIDEDNVFQSLVRPDVPIPPENARIHGITQADVADAPDFASVMARFAKWAGANVIGGYMVAFDLAVLKAEHERAALPWTQPLALDIRALVRLCAPQLPDEALETAAAWLNIKVGERHRALPDALTAARIFVALLPQLEERGILTLSAALKAVREQKLRAQGAEQAPLTEGLPARMAGRALDSYPFRHRVREVMRGKIVLGSTGMSLQQALQRMLEEHVSSLFVPPDEARGSWGILTERDILRAIAAQGRDVLDAPIQAFVSRPLKTVAENEFIYRAIARMAQLNVRHLGVRRRSDDAVIGVISQRDLLRYRAMEALLLSGRIEEAQSPAELARIWPTLVEVARAMRADNATANETAAVISRELRALTARACQLAEAQMRDEGRGAAPAPYGMMVLGSAGRGESLLAMDQDNALVLADGIDERAEHWFGDFATRVNAILAEAGVPLCRGGVMAKNAPWRRTQSQWLKVVRGWLSTAEPEDLLHVDIFFDLRRAHGDRDLVRKLRFACLDMAKGAQTLHKFLAMQAARFDSPLGWFGRLRTQQGRVDVKLGGLMPIFSAARVLALKLGSRRRATPARLEEAIEAGIAPLHLGREMITAHRILLELVLDQQLRDLEEGNAPSNRIAPAQLERYERDQLKWALQRAQMVPALLGVPQLPG